MLNKKPLLHLRQVESGIKTQEEITSSERGKSIKKSFLKQQKLMYRRHRNKTIFVSASPNVTGSSKRFQKSLKICRVRQINAISS